MNRKGFAILCVSLLTAIVTLGYTHRNRVKGSSVARDAETAGPVFITVSENTDAGSDSTSIGFDSSHEKAVFLMVESVPAPIAEEKTAIRPETAAEPASVPHPTPTTSVTQTPATEKTATPKPTAKATATPKPTAKATATPKATAKATATPKPTAKATATPKATAKATATPKPADTPKPTETQEPVQVSNPVSAKSCTNASETAENPAKQTGTSFIVGGTVEIPDAGTEETDSITVSASREFEGKSTDMLTPEPTKTPVPQPTPTPEPAITPKRVPTFTASGSYDWAALELAARVAYFEAGSEEGREAVLCVIFNRCRSKDFGGKTTSVETEVYRKSQFSVVRKEKFEMSTAPDALIRTADDIFNGSKNVLPEDIVFFRAVSRGTEWDGKEYYKTIGGNAFFRKAS